jgi:hypothetical protein
MAAQIGIGQKLWMLNLQTQRFFMDISRKNKTQKRFLKFFDNWPLSSNNKGARRAARRTQNFEKS